MNWRFCVGLVVVDARYGPREEGEDEGGVQGLVVDVTVPVQALVNNSQLVIPGGRSKVRFLSLMLFFPLFFSFFLLSLSLLDLDLGVCTGDRGTGGKGAACASRPCRGDCPEWRGPWVVSLTDFQITQTQKNNDHHNRKGEGEKKGKERRIGLCCMGMGMRWNGISAGWGPLTYSK